MTDECDADLRAAKDRIALSVLGGDFDVDPRLGRLRLRPHQVSAVKRLLEVMMRHRGALLADAVGLGKTYVALAIARLHARPLVICPAALRPMWGRASAIARLEIPSMSIESLAMGAEPGFAPDLVLVDEAHHLRTPSTKRYAAIATLARRSRMLLMSATPLQNSRRDLEALLGLFVGTSVASWSDGMIARLIVRRDAVAANQLLPAIVGPHALSPGGDDDCLEAILALPPSIPASDEGVAHALTTMSLIHLWASSRAALVASVRKRRARAIAMREAIASGYTPTSGELTAWQFADDALQLAFPFCAGQSGEQVDPGTLSRHLDDFVRAAAALIDRCREPPDPDASRVQLLTTLRARHIGDRVVAFSQYAHTISALGRLMRADRGIATITAAGGRIASGRITRAEIMGQFAGDARPTRDVERIDLLLTTDLLSEGIDLRGAAVIVHLDLPWNPARMEQRVGRARRIGSPHQAIHVYTFVPPTAAERMLELQRRLSAKVKVASALVGAGDSDVVGRSDSAGASPAPDSPVSAGEKLRARVADWLDPAARVNSRLIVAAARCSRPGWIASTVVDGLPRMIYQVGAQIGEDPSVCDALANEIGEAVPVDDILRQHAMRAITRWMASRFAVTGVGEQSAPKRAVLDRLSQTVARAPRHRRATFLDSAQRARRDLASVSGVGAERILAALARSPADDEAWIRSLETFGSLHANDGGTPVDDHRVTALILLV